CLRATPGTVSRSVPVTFTSRRPTIIFWSADATWCSRADRARTGLGPPSTPLFRSAAKTYGAGVVGIVLTGRLNDGTAGLYEVKRHGGITIVQDPSDALCTAMPASALRHVAVDHSIPLAGMPRILFQVCKDIASHSKDLRDVARTGGPSHA